MRLKFSAAHCPLTLPQERGIYTWSTGSWKRRVLLAPDPKHAGKKLAAGLMAVSGVSPRREAVQQFSASHCMHLGAAG
jgi:hypothetical protein